MASESDEEMIDRLSPQKQHSSRRGDVADDSTAICCVCAEGGQSAHVHSFAQCDSCGMVVHRDCYGAPLTREPPEALGGRVSWTCDSCAWGRTDESDRCVLCPQRGGLMKRTTDWRWAHLSCALWIPECFFRFGEGREPVDYFQVNGKRFKKTCCFCNNSEGACVDCTDPHCRRAFHITCGMEHRVYLEYKENTQGGADAVISLCDIHGKKWHDRRDAKAAP